MISFTSFSPVHTLYCGTFHLSKMPINIKVSSLNLGFYGPLQMSTNPSLWSHYLPGTCCIHITLQPHLITSCCLNTCYFFFSLCHYTCYFLCLEVFCVPNWQISLWSLLTDWAPPPLPPCSTTTMVICSDLY